MGDLNTLTGAIKTCFNKYATFDGRANRSEYWFFTLFVFVTLFVLTFVSIGLYTIFFLGIIIPHLAVACRRLHDTNRSGWFQLLLLIPIVGFILLIIWYATEGTKGKNNFGPQSK